jgi:hypothetical protein
MAVVNKQRSKSSTNNEKLNQKNTDRKFTHMNNINITMLFFFVRLTDKTQIIKTIYEVYLSYERRLMAHYQLVIDLY